MVCLRFCELDLGQTMTVLHCSAQRRRTPTEDAYDQFRLERQGNRLSPRTLGAYDYHLDGFFGWLHAEHPQVRQFKDLTVDVLRVYRAEMATRPGHWGRPYRRGPCRTR